MVATANEEDMIQKLRCEEGEAFDHCHLHEEQDNSSLPDWETNDMDINVSKKYRNDKYGIKYCNRIYDLTFVEVSDVSDDETLLKEEFNGLESGCDEYLEESQTF